MSLAAASGCALDDSEIVDDEQAIDEIDEIDEIESEVALPACAAGTWCIEPTPAGATTLHDVWAASANDVFAVGDNGTILRRQNNEWVAMASGTTASLRGVYGTSSTNVWAVGAGGTVLRFDGTSWRAAGPATTTNLEDIWVSGSSVFFCGSTVVWRSTNNGASFTSNSMTGSLFAISGVSASEVYVTGENSYVRKFNGTSWSTVNPGAGTTTYFAVLATGAGNVWVSDFMPSKETMQLKSNKWTAKPTASAVFQGLHGVSNDMWGVGASKIGRYNGTSWTSSTPLGTGASLWGVSGAGGHVYAVGGAGLVGHYVY